MNRVVPLGFREPPSFSDPYPLTSPYRLIEDKIVQRAATMVLNAVCEPEFAGFSYGARPGRSARQALAALDRAIGKKRVKWVLDADLRDFFVPSTHCTLVGGEG
jgi:retron-type reverse transcriptase